MKKGDTFEILFYLEALGDLQATRIVGNNKIKWNKRNLWM